MVQARFFYWNNGDSLDRFGDGVTTQFYNIQQPLLFFRLGKDMLGRRQGLEYGVNESKFFIQAYQEILIPFSALMKFLMRFPVRILPKSFTLFLYDSFLRK